MCDLSLIAGAALQGVGTYQAVRRAEFDDDTARRAADNRIAERDARAGFEIDRLRDRARALRARRRVDFAKAGVRVDGTPLDVLADLSGREALDAELIRRRATAAQQAIRARTDLDLYRARNRRLADSGPLGRILAGRSYGPFGP